MVTKHNFTTPSSIEYFWQTETNNRWDRCKDPCKYENCEQNSLLAPKVGFESCATSRESLDLCAKSNCTRLYSINDSTITAKDPYRAMYTNSIKSEHNKERKLKKVNYDYEPLGVSHKQHYASKSLGYYFYATWVLLDLWFQQSWIQLCQKANEQHCEFNFSYFILNFIKILRLPTL